MLFDTATIQPSQIYPLLVGGIIPRPIAWVSTQNKTGLTNLAPYSFFSVASVNPPILTITNIAGADRLAKDTLGNLLKTGECVINIVAMDQLDDMNQSCAGYSPEHSEIDEIGIETVASSHVSPPGIKASPVRYECTLRETLTLSDKPAGGVLVLLDVVAIYVDDKVVFDGVIQADLLNTVGKLGGNGYCTVACDIELERPVL
ncbi:nitrilotriacetate monooxygenase [Thiomicrorhabdus immobilis]|uniref:Nitrilotriacetate monooxygenase n=1 Tax=Thiomicrorhabdus immobilis TaxID=2791037 RepID=A0ABM7MAA3_9GAMM|nr:flavin reductase family protein [Thiomicrorhabdus immobilis]BCN92258.1 nitrilotriacetate monooxygenase [Thiomicrorhabdus immobilis]